jgi:diguanylate cyclase (GGDEF)-like protein
MMRKVAHPAGNPHQHQSTVHGTAGVRPVSRRSATSRPDINVLLVATDPDDARTVGNVLAGERGLSFNLHWVTRLPDDIGALGLGRTTVALLDLLVPDVDGIGALDRLLGAAPQLPVLVFSAVGDEDLARQAVQRGAQDYLLRNHLDGYSLPRALRNAIDRKVSDDALFAERERAQVTLDSIGDAVLSTDVAGNVAYLNSVAERMTGWSCEDALGRPYGEVLRIVDGATGQPAAPIHDRDGGIIGAVMVFRDVGETRALALEMSHRAQHDFLTDLPNAVLLDDRIAQAIGLAQRNRRQVAVLFVDLDHLKAINDARGHAAGDKLLQSIAKRLKACVRGSDTVSRKGGDEFVVLLSEIAHRDDAARTAEKIIAAVAAAHPGADHGLELTASVGIALYPLDGEDAPALLKSADAAMYRAKEAGRNRHRFASRSRAA